MTAGTPRRRSGATAPWAGVALGVVIALAAATSLAVAGGGGGNATETLVVGDGGYDSIQAAVDDADAGDQIRVEPGTYAESVRVDANVTLVAPDGAVLDGSDATGTAGVTIPAGSNVAPTVAGFTVRDFETGLAAARTGGDWTARNLTVLGGGFAAVDAAGSSGDWTLAGSSIRGVDGDGVYAPRSTGEWTVSDLAVGEVGFDAVDAHAATGDWRVGNLTVEGAGFAGVDAAGSTGDWRADGVDVGGGFDGVFAADSEGAWTVADAELTGVATGVAATDATGRWTLRATTVTGAELAGIGAVGATGNWTVRGATIRDGRRGVVATDTGGAWRIARSTVAGNELVGIDASGAAVEGDATRNWFGRGDGPTTNQCVGNVDCTAPLDRPPASALAVDHRVEPATVGPGGTATATVDVDPGSPRARLSLVVRVDRAVADVGVESLAVRGQGSIVAQAIGDDGLTVAVRNLSEDSRIHAVLTVSVPKNATEGTTYAVTGEVESDGGSAPVPTRTVTVGGAVARADADDDGTVDDAELQAALETWVAGGYTDAELGRIVDAWVEGG